LAHFGDFKTAALHATTSSVARFDHADPDLPGQCNAGFDRTAGSEWLNAASQACKGDHGPKRAPVARVCNGLKRSKEHPSKKPLTSRVLRPMVKVCMAQERLAVATSLTGHHSFVDALRRRVLEGPGQTEPALRQRLAARASGGPPIEAPYNDLAQQIGEAAYRTTDAQVARVLGAAGSEKAAFELIAAAATGAGLGRWQQAVKALKDAGDAAA
jgi:hypothetical protein